MNWLSKQLQRPWSMLAYDMLIVGGFMACIYFGFVK